MKKKFLFSFGIGFTWFIISDFFAIVWANDISKYLPAIYVWFVIIGMALLPGLFMSIMFFSNIFNRKVKKFKDVNENVTVIMCAKDEEKNIYGSINCICKQSYKGKIKLIVVDNNSKDRTLDIVNEEKRKFCNNLVIEVIHCPKSGKCNALNCSLHLIDTKYFITVDADTFLAKSAIQNIMNHIVNKKSACVAGSLYARNNKTFISKMQTYDYLLSIAAIKRFQGSYNSTLVTQGAFSAYETKVVRNHNGWKNCLGEDIVLTYEILRDRLPSTYEPTAVGYTTVPDNIKDFYKQRKRWAIGMLEGFSYVKPWNQGTYYSKYFTCVNILIIYIDLAYIVGFIPGIIMAICGYSYLIGIMTLLSILFSFVCYINMYLFQKKVGMPFRRNFFGFLCFLIFFQAFQSVAAINGYIEKLLRIRAKW